MLQLDKKERTYPCKPEWKIILEHLVYQDQVLIYRICRKMIITLDKMKIMEIHKLMSQLNPSVVNTTPNPQNDAQNWPKPKGSPFIAPEIIDQVFEIADKYFRDEDLTKLLSQWIHQENMSFLSNVLEKRHAPLAEVVDAVKSFSRMMNSLHVLSIHEIIGLRVSLIIRFLSENLLYINIAKQYISLRAIEDILEHIVGPALGNGKLGGKSAGLILAFQIISQKKLENTILKNVVTPKSWFITSDGVMEFVHYNALEEFVFTKYLSSEEISREFSFVEYIFKNSPFPPESIFAFTKILEDLKDKPLVVRSSSLLEDSFEASFSGKYKSLFLSNIGTKEERLSAFCNAIAEVYASTFGPDPIEYRKERGLLDFREEMGVLIQEVVGTKIGKYYMPSYAGVAFSNNEFRWSKRIRREDGVIRLVAGLGTRAVDRTINDYPILVSPGQPDLKVNTSVEDRIRYSQQYIDVINLETNRFETIDFKDLIKEAKGYFPGIEKIVSYDRSGELIAPVSSIADFSKENLVVTFQNLIDKKDFIYQIREILKVLSDAFHSPVDIEFASDGEKLYLLQCRPQVKHEKESEIHIPKNIPQSDLIFTANQYVSNGFVDDIEYVVYVDSDGYSSLQTSEQHYETGYIISKLNRELPKRKFILIGPGRWGSKGDIKLGVPVIYSDINNTAMLIEVSREKSGYVPELSFGTHFFQDLVEANIKYLPLYPDNKENYFNEEFFTKSPNMLCNFIENCKEYENTVKVIQTNTENKHTLLTIYMDGESGKAAAFIKRRE